MTATNLILTVAFLLATAVITALVDRWANARQQVRRQIDVIKRGEICPWTRAD